MAELHKLAQAMCSIDLAESYWTQVSYSCAPLLLGRPYKGAVAWHCANDPSGPLVLVDGSLANSWGSHQTITRAYAHARTHTQELPRLPVPDLWLTVSRYLASLKAVLAPVESADDMPKQEGCKLSLEQIKSNWQQFEHTDQLVKQFMLNEGPQLQRDLKEYANKCQNWVGCRAVVLRPVCLCHIVCACIVLLMCRYVILCALLCSVAPRRARALVCAVAQLMYFIGRLLRDSAPNNCVQGQFNWRQLKVNSARKSARRVGCVLSLDWAS